MVSGVGFIRAGTQAIVQPDFIFRLKMKSDLDGACRIKARRDFSDKVPGSLDSLVEAAKEELPVQARQFIVSLIEVLLKDVRLNVDIVRGMACFDPAVLLVLPLEEALFFLKSLYSSFKRRGWMSNCAEDDLCNEYVGFLEHFRCTYSNFKDSLEAFTDMTALLSNMPEFRARKLLFYLFRLSCLCLTEENVALPPVKFPGVGSESPPSRLSEVTMASQSYLSQVPNSVNICTNDVALAKNVELEAKFNDGNVSGDT